MGDLFGPHREHLRLFLLADDPADFLRYPALVTALTHERHHIPDLIIRPFSARIEGRRAYAVIITGFLFHFFVSNQNPPERLCVVDSSSRMETFRYTSRTSVMFLSCNNGALKLQKPRLFVTRRNSSDRSWINRARSKNDMRAELRGADQLR